ncbi:MAG: protein-L-isoaspartate(D-aspartate) O-methyltransferase [Nitrospirae bacterium]|nr:protein-L-isoaspartate(D-aspartate) O-methyltransferase [Nitrospirota bacterium]
MATDKFYKERQMMVQYQIRARGVKDEKVLSAMEKVPRHLFVSESLRDSAYSDSPLPAGEGQTISQPYMVAMMTEMLELKGHERVLEIGTGSGYQAAVLSVLASEVYTVERIEPLALKAERLLKDLGYLNVHVHVGDGTLGLPEYAPFDAIIVTAASPKVQETYVKQLKLNGRLVIPVGERYTQVISLTKKTPSGIVTSTSTPCVFVPLIGKNGWSEEDAN